MFLRNVGGGFDCAPRPGGAKEGFSWFGCVWAATALGRVGLEGAGEPGRVGWEGSNTLGASVWKRAARAGAAQWLAENHGSKLATIRYLICRSTKISPLLSMQACNVWSEEKIYIHIL